MSALEIRRRHSLTCPDDAPPSYAEQAHADVLELLGELERERKVSEWLARWTTSWEAVIGSDGVVRESVYVHFPTYNDAEVALRLTAAREAVSDD